MVQSWDGLWYQVSCHASVIWRRLSRTSNILFPPFHLHLWSNRVFNNSNAPDFASRAKRPSAALWPQLISVPFAFSLVSFIGIIVSSSSQTIYGEAIWSPIDLLGKFLDGKPSHATRFGVSFQQKSCLRTMYYQILTGLVHFCFLHHRSGKLPPLFF